jgi:hypothetical protein
MKNIWKGLVVGGLTGVTAGIIVDSLSKAPETAKGLGRHMIDQGKQAIDHAPEAGRWVHSVAEKAAEIVHDSEVPDRVRDGAHRIKESDIARRASKAV